MTCSAGWRTTRRFWLIAMSSIAITPSSSAFLTEAKACTTFCVVSKDRVILGKNYDWYIGRGLLLVNKRGVERSSEPPGDRGKSWVSKYGSITFNQYGRDLPAGGMNEAGLVIEVLWMNGSVFPKPDHRPAASANAWVQYQLDTARSVGEVVDSDAEVRLTRRAVPVHFFAADRSGDIAVIEFRDGVRVVHRGPTLPAPALANDFYVDALARTTESDRAAQTGDRFAQAARRARDFAASTHGDPVAYAFATLAEVAQKPGLGNAVTGFAPPVATQWSIVYELDRLRVHFRTTAAPAIKMLTLDDLDFSCVAPVLMLDLHEPAEGDATALLKPYARDANLALIRETFAQTGFLRGLPEVDLQRVASWPEKGSCTLPATR
jgi:penicillin V acylase-like amidase (Ntn superfamily)